MLVSQDKVINN